MFIRNAYGRIVGSYSSKSRCISAGVTFPIIKFKLELQTDFTTECIAHLVSNSRNFWASKTGQRARTCVCMLGWEGIFLQCRSGCPPCHSRIRQPSPGSADTRVGEGPYGFLSGNKATLYRLYRTLNLPALKSLSKKQVALEATLNQYLISKPISFSYIMGSP